MESSATELALPDCWVRTALSLTPAFTSSVWMLLTMSESTLLSENSSIGSFDVPLVYATGVRGMVQKPALAAPSGVTTVVEMGGLVLAVDEATSRGMPTGTSVVVGIKIEMRPVVLCT